MRDIALITGASGDIGSSIAMAFARADYDLAIHYHTNRDKAEALRAAAIKAGVRAYRYQADISSSAQARDMIARANADLGEITCLINCAGYSEAKLFQDISDEEWEHMFAVHVHGAFYCCKAVVPAMIRRGKGVIVNISSIWGRYGASCEVHYSAAKAALDGLTRALAKELGPSGVRVNSVAPGVISSRMNSGYDDESIRELSRAAALDRSGSPGEVADLVLFLASDKASYITGQIIGADGGFFS